MKPLSSSAAALRDGLAFRNASNTWLASSAASVAKTTADIAREGPPASPGNVQHCIQGVIYASLVLDSTHGGRPSSATALNNPLAVAGTKAHRSVHPKWISRGNASSGVSVCGARGR